MPKIKFVSIIKNMKNKFQPKSLLQHPYDPLKKIRVAVNGFIFVIKYDFSVTYKVIISLIVLIVTFYFREYTNFLLILIATGYMLSIEIINSCIELICDFQVTEYNEKIKVIKDVSAAATGISIFIWSIVLSYDIFGIIKNFI